MLKLTVPNTHTHTHARTHTHTHTQACTHSYLHTSHANEKFCCLKLLPRSGWGWQRRRNDEQEECREADSNVVQRPSNTPTTFNPHNVSLLVQNAPNQSTQSAKAKLEKRSPASCFLHHFSVFVLSPFEQKRSQCSVWQNSETARLSNSANIFPMSATPLGLGPPSPKDTQC